jgi:hypothetical protein
MSPRQQSLLKSAPTPPRASIPLNRSSRRRAMLPAALPTLIRSRTEKALAKEFCTSAVGPFVHRASSASDRSRHSSRSSGAAGKSHFSPFRVLDTSLTVCGSVYMNEGPKLGSGQSGLNVQLWVITTLGRDPHRTAHFPRDYRLIGRSNVGQPPRLSRRIAALILCERLISRRADVLRSRE